jgi:hypothetical protein
VLLHLIRSYLNPDESFCSYLVWLSRTNFYKSLLCSSVIRSFIHKRQNDSPGLKGLLPAWKSPRTHTDIAAATDLNVDDSDSITPSEDASHINEQNGVCNDSDEGEGGGGGTME